MATEALKPLAWGISLHMKTLAETETNPEYRKKAAEIIDILFGDDKDDFIRKIYNSLI